MATRLLALDLEANVSATVTPPVAQLVPVALVPMSFSGSSASTFGVDGRLGQANLDVSAPNIRPPVDHGETERFRIIAHVPVAIALPSFFFRCAMRTRTSPPAAPPPAALWVPIAICAALSFGDQAGPPAGPDR